jgi:hypothetical protein
MHLGQLREWFGLRAGRANGGARWQRVTQRKGSSGSISSAF